MALNFSFVVPKEVVEAEGPDFGHKPSAPAPIR